MTPSLGAMIANLFDSAFEAGFAAANRTTTATTFTPKRRGRPARQNIPIKTGEPGTATPAKRRRRRRKMLASATTTT